MMTLVETLDTLIAQETTTKAEWNPGFDLQLRDGNSAFYGVFKTDSRFTWITYEDYSEMVTFSYRETDFSLKKDPRQSSTTYTVRNLTKDTEIQTNKVKEVIG